MRRQAPSVSTASTSTTAAAPPNAATASTAPTVPALNRDYVRLVEQAPPFGLRDKIGYMLGDLGFNSLQTLINSYFMLFAVNILGIESTHFALIIFACRALDACNDTFIGIAVDRRAGDRRGKMRPWLKWFAVPYFLMTVVMFIDVTAAPYAARVAWVLVAYFVWAVVGTFINVPYGAMSNVVTSSLVERTELSNFRSIGSFGASIATTTIVPLLLFDQDKNPVAERFVLLSLILGAFCTVCLFLAHRLLSERVVIATARQKGEKVDYLKVVKSFAHNRILIAVVASYIITKLFTQPVSTMNQYVFMVYFQNTDLLSVASVASFPPMLVAMAVLKPMVKRFGKRNLVTWPLLGAVACYLGCAFLPMTPVTWIALQVASSTFTVFSGLLLWSLISDAVDYQAYLTHQHNEATVYAVVTFVVFFAGSASTSIIALLLEAAGYAPAAGSLNQAAGVAENIKALVGVWPAIGCLLSFVAMKFIYNLSDAQMAAVAAELQREADEEARAVEAVAPIEAAAGTSERAGARAGRADASHRKGGRGHDSL